MKQFWKRAVAAFLAVLMVVSLSVTALAAAENQEYDRNSAGTEKLITGYTASGSENGVLDLAAALKATERVDGKFVIVNYTFTGVQDNAFNRESTTVNGAAKSFLETVKELIVADGIKDIGSYAFANMPALEKVTFKGDAVLADHAFLNCPKLAEVTFEKNAELGTEAFYGDAALTKLTFGQDVTFKADCLKNADNVKDLIFNEDAAVSDFSNLKDSAYVGNYPVDFIMNGSTLVYYKGNDEEVTIPLNVTAIGDGAFANNRNIRTVNISKYVETLGDCAFEGCANLTDVNFATFGSVKNIGADVFTGTPFFERFDGDFFTIGTLLIKYLGDDDYVYIPNTVTAIAPDCFMGCYAASDREDDDTKSGYTWVVSSVFVPASVTSLGENCFALDQLEDGSYYLPKIYAYNKTAAMDALKEEGYDVTAMPALADVDGNGKIEAEDARRALRLSVHLDLNTPPEKVHAADIDGDGIVTAADARTILRLVVELEDYLPEDLLTMPRTKTEIMMAYVNALDMAKRYNAGYTKASASAITGSDMCPAASSHFYNTLGKKGAVNETKTFAPNTKEALDNLYVSAVVSEKSIESAACTLDANGKYVIDIKFKNVDDNYGASAVAKAMPAKTRDYFASDFTGKSWWNGTNESNSLTKFDLGYKDCSVHAVLAKADNKLENVKQAVGYHFALSGRISGLSIAPKLWKAGDATLDRAETFEYTQFIYNPIVNDLQ